MLRTDYNKHEGKSNIGSEDIYSLLGTSDISDISGTSAQPEESGLGCASDVFDIRF